MTTEGIKPTVDNKVEEQPIEVEEAKGKRPVTKEKLRSIMEAASALTALGDEDECEDGSSTGQPHEDNDEDNDGDEEGDDSPYKRYIPEHKKPDAALTFPEKLMAMMHLAEKEDPKTFCIAWLLDGKSFVIRNPEEFTRNILPQFFKATKFSSYTRKLYRWGFRQVNRGIGPDDPIIFGNEYFQRDKAELMVKMRSITAAGTRKIQTMEQAQHEIEESRSNKRPLDANMMNMDEQRKRIMLEHMLQQQKFGGMQAAPDQQNYLQQQASFQQFNLASALRPSMAMQHQMGFNKQMAPMNTQSFNQNPLSLYMAPQPQPHLQQQHSAMPQNQQYNSASTAEIVNAAINALRYAS